MKIVCIMIGVKIAYLLLVHKSPEQVNLFIQQLLNYGDSDVYVHVDKKNKELIDKLVKSPRVFVLSKYNVRWGSFEIVKAAIDLMRLACESGQKYTHIYLGSGQDLLIKKGLYNYLERNIKNTFIHIGSEITNRDRESARYRICWPKFLMIRNDLHIYRFIRIVMQILCSLDIVLRNNKRRLNRPVRFYEGHTWFIAPFEVNNYIVNYVKDNPDYYEYWEDSLASDLMFFQTIIMNSPYAIDVKEELMYVEFGHSFTTMNHPLSINSQIFSKIKDDNYFCARKFEWEEDEGFIKEIVKNTLV